MKKVLFFLLLGGTVLNFYSFRQIHNSFEDILDQLGLRTEEAQSYITSNIWGGSTTFPKTRIMAKMALNKREEAVKEIGSYVRAYVESLEFAKTYETALIEQKPAPPSDPLYQGPEDVSVYKEDLKRWEIEYPKTLNILLKKRLTYFLQITSSIDYNAKLEKQGSKMIFSDPVLEAKDELWKACFRAGKPSVDAARSFAKQWLLELK